MKTLVVILIISVFLNGLAQTIEVGGLPYSKMKNIDFIYSQDKVLNLPRLNSDSILLTQNTNIIAIPNNIELNTTNSGVWFTLPNGDKIWVLKIKCVGAKHLTISFKKFDIPDSSYLFAYNDKIIKGAYVFSSDSNSYMIHQIYGDNATVELYVTKNKEKFVNIDINKIYAGLYDFSFEKNNNLRTEVDDFCVPNVNCPEFGADWQQEKKGVAVFNDGLRSCNGTLINNTQFDGRLLFLTADHCVSGISLNTYFPFSFGFNLESAECTIISTPNSIDVVGAKILARYDDIALLELSEDPRLKGADVFFNGWKTYDPPLEQNLTKKGAIIHSFRQSSGFTLPSMRISPIKSIFRNIPQTYINVFIKRNTGSPGVYAGVHEGSSGSPNFAPDGLIFGVTKAIYTFPNVCSTASCLSASIKEAYNKNSSFRQILNNTDPDLDWGNNFVFNGSCPGISGNCTKKFYDLDYTFKDTPGGYSQALNNIVSNVTPRANRYYPTVYEAGKNIHLKPGFKYRTYYYPGWSTFHAKISNCRSNNSRKEVQDFEFKSEIDYDFFNFKIIPNPSDDGIFEVKLKQKTHQNVNINVFSTDGRLVFKNKSDNFELSTILKIDLSNLKSGIYILKIKSNEINETHKIIKN
ncbi:MAG: T9SS C-terminal target domain-containing protein [Cytophagales bacterium]|nr:MAG: T9SS C-terminal target domain-containing protein [Cytophagales bacterium]